MESNGVRGRIHCSVETAVLIEKAGKKWAIPREDKVQVKGKGELQTFWLEFGKRSDNLAAASNHSAAAVAHDEACCDNEQTIQSSSGPKRKSSTMPEEAAADDKLQRLVDWNVDVFCRVLKGAVSNASEPEFELDAQITMQIQNYVRTIASMYGDHSFHNFEHVSLHWVV
jgi:Adenylate and Guanylate cyclase catalytic domain